MLLGVCGRRSGQVERGGQLLALLLQEAARRELHVEPRSLGMAKRGVCTFVQKAHALQAAGSQLTVVVNNGRSRIGRDEPFLVEQLTGFVSASVFLSCSFSFAANDLADIPAGKEKTDTLSVPIAIAAENDGFLPDVSGSRPWSLTERYCLSLLQRS